MKLTLPVTMIAVCSSIDGDTSSTWQFPPESQWQSLYMPGGPFSPLQSKQHSQSRFRLALILYRRPAHEAPATPLSSLHHDITQHAQALPLPDSVPPGPTVAGTRITSASTCAVWSRASAIFLAANLFLSLAFTGIGSAHFLQAVSKNADGWQHWLWPSKSSFS